MLFWRHPRPLHHERGHGSRRGCNERHGQHVEKSQDQVCLVCDLLPGSSWRHSRALLWIAGHCKALSAIRPANLRGALPWQRRHTKGPVPGRPKCLCAMLSASPQERAPGKANLCTAIAVRGSHEFAPYPAELMQPLVGNACRSRHPAYRHTHQPIAVAVWQFGVVFEPDVCRTHAAPSTQSRVTLPHSGTHQSGLKMLRPLQWQWSVLGYCGTTITSANVELCRHRPGSRKARPGVQGAPVHLCRAPRGEPFWLPVR